MYILKIVVKIKTGFQTCLTQQSKNKKRAPLKLPARISTVMCKRLCPDSNTQTVILKQLHANSYAPIINMPENCLCFKFYLISGYFLPKYEDIIIYLRSFGKIHVAPISSNNDSNPFFSRVIVASHFTKIPFLMRCRHE